MYLGQFLILLILTRDATSRRDGPKISDDDEWYPTYHLAPETGWMNDPNGLIWFGGYYHAFYQHNPYAPVWIREQITWGHARSKDMMNWERLPTALSPSLPEDAQGCFSGSAVNDNGRLTLIYTANFGTTEQTAVQTLCLATSNDTIRFTKRGKVLESSSNIHHFRDPKVWNVQGVWYMVLSTGYQGDLGQVLMYKSANLYQWSYEGVVAQADTHSDRKWETPDMFKLGCEYVLLFSSQALKNKEKNFPQTGYLVGRWSPGNKFVADGKGFKLIDSGHDYYASQTFQAPDGRRIMIGWMGVPDGTPPERKYGWAGMLTIPRELRLSHKNAVEVVPVREAEKLRQNPPLACGGQTMLMDGSLKISDIPIRAAELIITWNLWESEAEEYGIRLGNNAYNMSEGLYLRVNTKSRSLILDRRYSGVSGINRRIPLSGGHQNLLILRVYFDKSSVEVFVNRGEACMTSRIYPRKNTRVLSMYAINGFAKVETYCLWNLNKIC